MIGNDIEDSVLLFGEGTQNNATAVKPMSSAVEPRGIRDYFLNRNSYQSNRLEYKDEMILAEEFFKNRLDDAYVNNVKAVLYDKRGIVLNTADIFEIALSNVMATPKTVLENYHINTDKLDGRRNEVFDRKVGSLYKYLLREKSDKKITADGEELYVAALNAIKANGFSTVKQHIVDNIFSQLKEQKISSGTFKEIAKSKRKPSSLRDVSNPAVFVYDAVLENRFDKEFIGRALSWYSFSVSDDYYMGFYDSTIGEKDILDSSSLALNSIRCSAQINESFDYITYITRIKSAHDFLKKAGFDYAAKHLDADVDVDAAIRIMKQQVGKYEGNAVETVVDAIEFLRENGIRLPEHDMRWILEKYLDPKHPIQAARNSGNKRKVHLFAYDRSETPQDKLNNRIRRLYAAFGGKSEFGLSPSEQYELDKKRNDGASTSFAADPFEEADRKYREQRDKERQEEERAEKAQEEMEKNGFKGKEVIFQINSITNTGKGVVNGTTLNLNLPHKIIAKKVSGAKGDCFKAKVVKKLGDHYEVTDVKKYDGPLDFKKDDVRENNSW